METGICSDRPIDSHGTDHASVQPQTARSVPWILPSGLPICLESWSRKSVTTTQYMQKSL